MCVLPYPRVLVFVYAKMNVVNETMMVFYKPCENLIPSSTKRHELSTAA